MYKNWTFGIFISLAFVAQNLSAQEVWTLERCINHATENNRVIKQSQLQVKNAKLTNKQSRFDVYPSLSANSNLGFNFGRSVNPATYQFENVSTSFNAWGINTSVALYNGGRIQNTIKQSAADVQAAQADLEQSAQTIALQVASAYLQILLAEEQLANARKRSQNTQNQLDRIERQIKAGALPTNARYDLAAQLARDEQQIVTTQNNTELNYLNLKNLLELPPDQNMRIEAPSVILPADANPDAFSFKAVYNQALGSQPQIRAGESRIKSAQIGVRIAEAQLLPSLFASGNLNTNYSSTIQNFVSTRRDISQNVVIGGQNVTVVFPGQEILAPSGKKPYFSQIGDNFGYGLGFNLQIPIFDGFSRRIGVERQQLNVENQIITLERTKQQLKSDVQNAIANARAARKQYEAAQKTFEAQKAAFDATEKRFQIGAANGFEFTQSRNQLDQAERDVVVAKYDYLFKMKVVEFYEGKKLSLK